MTSYWRETRAPRYSLLFALPLLVLYEVLARVVTAESGIRNGADVLLKSLFLLLGGRHGLTLFAVVVLGTALVLVVRDWHRSGAPAARYFVGMFTESVVYATCFGAVTSLLTGLLLRGTALSAGTGTALGLPTELVVSLGAGIYEELLFRVVVVGAVSWAIAQAGLLAPGPAAAVAAAVSALVFSLAHYVGPYGDAFAAGSFVFRFLGGLVFSAIYVLRGFGIVTWTHALYDVLFLLVLRRR